MNNMRLYARWKQMGCHKLKSPNESDYEFYQQGEIFTRWIFNYKTLHAPWDLSE